MRSRRKPVAIAAAALVGLGAGAGATVAVGQGGQGDQALFGVLRGANEIGENGERGAGDPDGRGSATGIIDGGRLCFGLMVANIEDPAAAHIHRGRRNQNGPVVIELRPPEDGDPGAVSGCVSVRSALARQIRRNPAGFYWNVHTQDYPGGAVRGQLLARRR